MGRVFEVKNDCEPEFIRKMRSQIRLGQEKKKESRKKEKEEEEITGDIENKDKADFAREEVKCQICFGKMGGGSGMGCWTCLFFICLKCELRFQGFEL